MDFKLLYVTGYSCNGLEWTTATSAPKNVVLRLYLDKGLLNEGVDLLLARVGGRRICKEVQIVLELKMFISIDVH